MTMVQASTAQYVSHRRKYLIPFILLISLVVVVVVIVEIPHCYTTAFILQHQQQPSRAVELWKRKQNSLENPVKQQQQQQQHRHIIIGTPTTLLASSSLSEDNPYSKIASLQEEVVHDEVKKYDGNDNNDGDNDDRIRNVRFSSPLIEYGYKPAVDEYIELKEYQKQQQQQQQSTDRRRPLLLFLPGFDGTYLSPFLQFPELHTIFDVRCMVVGINDRSTYDELIQSVIYQIEMETSKTTNISIQEKNSGFVNQSTNTSNSNEQSNTTSSTDPGAIITSFFGSILKSLSGNDDDSRLKSRPIYLAGESFGGILASDVALYILDRNTNYTKTLQQNNNNNNNSTITIPPPFINLKGLCLINAATCYDRSRLAAEGPKVSEMPNWLYPFGLMTLLPLFSDDYSMSQLIAILQGRALPSVIDNETREAYMGRVAISLPFVIPFITRDALRWRLNAWLATGCEKMASGGRLQDLGVRYPKFRLLVVAGENDRCLPSIAEAARISSLIPDTIVHVVEGAGHASTCGSRVDLAALFRKRYPELIVRYDQQITKDDNDDDDSRKKTEKKKQQQQQQYSTTSGNRRPDGYYYYSTRTNMKEIAVTNSGILFGMEPRYDNKTIGLSPLKYWSSKYYRKLPLG